MNLLNRLDPDEQLKVLQAVSRLKRDEEFNAFFNFLCRGQCAFDAALRTAATETIQAQQGAARLLDELVALIANSDDMHQQLIDEHRRGNSRSIPSQPYRRP